MIDRQRLSRLVPVIEVALILGVGILFVRPYWNFDDSVVPAGKEFESNSGWIGVARRAILEFQELPLWNHSIDTGLPYLGTRCPTSQPSGADPGSYSG